MKVLELFAGTRSIGKAFENRGHQVFSVEWDKNFENIDLYADILTVTTDEILNRFGRPDVIWASPDCSTFSIAAISHQHLAVVVVGVMPVPGGEVVGDGHHRLAHWFALGAVCNKQLQPALLFCPVVPGIGPTSVFVQRRGDFGNCYFHASSSNPGRTVCPGSMPSSIHQWNTSLPVYQNLISPSIFPRRFRSSIILSNAAM